jgi:hypothetical protein
VVGVGVLFEIWIVDASINVFVLLFVGVSSVHHQPGVPAACCCFPFFALLAPLLLC